MLTHHVRVQTKMYQQPATCNIRATLNLRWWIVMLFPRGIEVWSDYFKHITAVKELKTRLRFLTHTSLVSYLITKCCEHCHTTSSPHTHPSFTEVCFFYLSHVNLCTSKHLLHVAFYMWLSATWLLQLLASQSLYIMHEFIMQHDSAGLYILLFRPVPACPDSACKHEKDDCSLFNIRSVVKHEFQAGRTHFFSWGENAVLTFLFVCSLNFFWASSPAHRFKNSKEII